MRALWEFISESSNWTGPRGIFNYTVSHVQLSLVAMLLSALLAIPAAIWLGHRHRDGGWFARLGESSVTGVNLLRSLPSFAVVVFVLPFSIRFGFGLGFWPTCAALVLLGIPPMFVNTYVGVRSTPDELIQAGMGIGMTDSQLLRQVEIPTALPLIVTGVRIASSQIIATATLGALVGFEGLGTFIVSGLRRGASGVGAMLTGAMGVALLAILAELAFTLFERRAMPWNKPKSGRVP